MDNIKEKAKKLGEEIYQSDLYQSYLYYKERVENKTALKQQIDELKRLQLSQGLRRRQREFVSLKEEEDLSKAYSEVALDPDGMGFWESEKKNNVISSRCVRNCSKTSTSRFWLYR